METIIFVITHCKVDDCFIKGKAEYKLLQCGKDKNKDFGYLRANTEDNISKWNMFYGELIGHYWIWKNIKYDIVGISHYHRYFLYDHELLRKEKIEELLNEYDIIVPTVVAKNEIMKRQWADWHQPKDFREIERIVLEHYPEYKEDFIFHATQNLDGFHACNLLITRKEIFDEYCEWLFSILEELREETDLNNRDYPTDSSKRVGAFAAERLFNIWLSHSGYSKVILEYCDFGKDAFILAAKQEELKDEDNSGCSDEAE